MIREKETKAKTAGLIQERKPNFKSLMLYSDLEILFETMGSNVMKMEKCQSKREQRNILPKMMCLSHVFSPKELPESIYPLIKYRIKFCANVIQLFELESHLYTTYQYKRLI